MLDHYSGKDSNNGKHYKTKKVHLKKSSKSSINKCTKYGKLGHKICLFIVIWATKKVNMRLFKWGGKTCLQEKHKTKLKGHEPKI